MRNEVKLANPNYDSSKIEEFKNVWVFCEQRQGQMMSTSYELISEGRKLADELGVKLCGLLVGDNVGDLAESIGGYGADEVIVCDHPLLKNYTTDAYAKVICDVISEMKPEAFLIGATNIGRDLGPRCAARLHTGLSRPEDDPSRVRRQPDGYHHLPALPSLHGDGPSRRYEEGCLRRGEGQGR